LVAELGPQGTVSRDYCVRAGTHEVSFAWRFSSDGSYAATHHLHVELMQFEAEDVELTVHSARKAFTADPGPQLACPRGESERNFNSD